MAEETAVENKGEIVAVPFTVKAGGGSKLADQEVELRLMVPKEFICGVACEKTGRYKSFRLLNGAIGKSVLPVMEADASFMSALRVSLLNVEVCTCPEHGSFEASTEPDGTERSEPCPVCQKPCPVTLRPDPAGPILKLADGKRARKRAKRQKAGDAKAK